LFSAAQKKAVTAGVEADLKLVKQLINSDVKVKTFLETPTISREMKKTGLTQIFGSKKYQPITINFFNLLAENGRLDQTFKIIQSYESLMMSSRNQVPVVITTATAMDKSIADKVKQVLLKKKLAGEGVEMLISNKIDSQIIGGMIIEIGDNTIDMSVSSKLSKLNSLLTQSV
jgi:F-type H+-transporting ATPase subunit O